MNERTEPFLVSQPASALGVRGVLQRYASLDVARGLIMIVMALDHASNAWNSGRVFLEGGVGIPPVQYPGAMQQFTREITHICAPGFQLLAGMGLAISVFRRQARGLSEWSISGDMILRGLALCFCDFVLMYYGYDRAPLFFIVLACIGTCIMVFSLARFLPLWLIAPLSAVVLFAAPSYAQEEFITPSASQYPINVLFNVALSETPHSPFMVLYPIFPWIACFGFGWCLGTIYERRPSFSARPLVIGGAAVLIGAFFLRWFGGEYADRLPIGDGPASSAFWALSKYPPTPAFLLATLGALFVMLGVLRPLDARERVGGLWQVALVYGRVALFFYIVHMYLYHAYPHSAGTVRTYGLGTTYLVWIAGLVAMFPLCLLYHRARLRWPRVLRYSSAVSGR